MPRAGAGVVAILIIAIYAADGYSNDRTTVCVRAGDRRRVAIDGNADDGVVAVDEWWW